MERGDAARGRWSTHSLQVRGEVILAVEEAISRVADGGEEGGEACLRAGVLARDPYSHLIPGPTCEADEGSEALH